MLPHHAETIQRTTDHFAAQPGVLGLLLGGSLVLTAMLVVELAPRRRIEAEVQHIAV